MKRFSLTITALLLGTIALAGCEKKAPQEKTEEANNILSHQIDALDKAKDLERQLNKSENLKRKAIEDMTK